jgi:hypothetical protein
MAAAWSWLALLTNGESVPAMPSVCTRLHSFNLFFILAAVWSYFFWSFWSCRHSNANQARSPPHPCSYSPWAQPIFRLHSCGPSGWLRPSRSFNLEPPLRDFPFTSTTVNFDYAARKHKVRSFLHKVSVARPAGMSMFDFRILDNLSFDLSFFLMPFLLFFSL